MPRHYAIGNGTMLINLDAYTRIRDLYYPYVGQLNHVGGHPCRIGVWADGAFAWLDEGGWRWTPGYVPDSLVTQVTAEHEGLGLVLEMGDGVHQRDNIYIKQLRVTNRTDREREIRLFVTHDFSIDETEVGDTAAFYPRNGTVFHYKKNRYFMANGLAGGEGIVQYAMGVKRFHQAEGTWRDAEDGHLMGNSIAQGSVDSTIGLRLRLGANGSDWIYYWLSVGDSLEEVTRLDQYVRDNDPGKLLDRIHVYWQRWSNKIDRDYADLPPSVISMFKQSLLVVRTQTDARGAIVAANDTDILNYNRDHYSYMWPRDGALVAYAMSVAGYHETVVPFYRFCSEALSPEGYLHHKYNPDGTVGSSWHPFIADGHEQLPIQEDETALVLFSLWQMYLSSGNIELCQSLYGSLIRKAAKFMRGYILDDLSLPKPSYDLWEERYGIYTFTASAVFGGLKAAADFCALFGDRERSERYMRVADSVRDGIIKHLWDEESGRFARGLVLQDGVWVKDMTPESSIYGIFEFGVLAADDPLVVSTMRSLREQLTIRTDIGGIARYKNDYYFQRSPDIERIPGNPWIICTLWMAEWEIECARSMSDLETPRRTLEWVTGHALESGMLPEQLDPLDGGPLSVAPLTWSHATFVLTVVKYLNKAKELQRTEGRG
ncbi:glycoside hydrolase family 15 protein [Paenibacillus ginsengarvi]|uniref:Glycoside hydrolase family 15 protein n=1 Tax=Paenibacillus ginsengarvi TaxID=400777 RepID=A0A3B0BIR7_9BACL|nr:glycoside hydrolase family 15 protein [Paenibacillus ginsengarvi]RKN73013.1 glycoside hydrolase family 15 protein [Paenibacillus ginsengarvi]